MNPVSAWTSLRRGLATQSQARCGCKKNVCLARGACGLSYRRAICCYGPGSEVETSQSLRTTRSYVRSRTHQVRLPLPSAVCERDHLVRLGLFQQPLQPMSIGPFQLFRIHRHPRTGHPGQSVLHVSDRIGEPFDLFVIMTQGAAGTNDPGPPLLFSQCRSHIEPES